MSQQRHLRLGSVIVAILAFVIYSWSFNRFPALEEVIGSAVGETDVGAYKAVYLDFGFNRQLGDEYRRTGRTNADIAEKHRIHHPITAATGRALTALFAVPYRWLGLDPTRAIYSVSALFMALNVLMLARLLAADNPNRNPVWPFVLLYAAGLSTVLYGSMPDSWPLTAFLVLCLFEAIRDRRGNPWLIAAALGVICVNNMAASSALAMLWLRFWHEGIRGSSLIAKVVGTGVVTLATWLACLLGLSLIDPVYRPDHLVAYSVWFRQFVGADLPPTSPYVWKAIVAGLYFNAFVANPDDPNVPPEALQDTVQHGGVGLVALLGLVALYAVVVVRWVLYRRGDRARGLPFLATVSAPPSWPAAYALLLAIVTLALFYPGGFTYSVLALPFLTITLHRFADMRRPLDRILVPVVVLLVLVNTGLQVRRFRERLATPAQASSSLESSREVPGVVP